MSIILILNWGVKVMGWYTIKVRPSLSFRLDPERSVAESNGVIEESLSIGNQQ
jgi:hypothetical protein